MSDKLFTQQDLAKRWQVTVHTIEEWRKNGVIQPVKGIPAIRFTEQHIMDIEGVKLDRMSPLERKRLELEADKLRTENEKLKGIISNVLTEASQIISILH